MPETCRALQPTPRLDLVVPGRPVAVDCEGVILPNESGIKKTGLGRTTFVNEKHEVILDTFSFYPRHMEARPNPKFLALGVYWADLKPRNGAQPHARVINMAKKILDKAGVVVGHAISNDINMLRDIDFGQYEVMDTQQHAEYRAFALDKHHRVCDSKLDDLAREFLGYSIQDDDHCSVRDATATMKLHQRHVQVQAELAQAAPSSSSSAEGLDESTDGYSVEGDSATPLTTPDEEMARLDLAPAANRAAPDTLAIPAGPAVSAAPVGSWAKIAASNRTP